MPPAARADLNYGLDTDQTNTGGQPIELLQLGVSHVGFDSAESHAAITSASVSVSFDSGKTWQPATMTGSGGRYIAAGTTRPRRRAPAPNSR